MTDIEQLLTGLRGVPGTSAPRLVAVGWATVDGDRTIAGMGAGVVRPGAQDDLLGARSWVIDVGPVPLVVLEPSTESRLAAALARNGEGIVALYLAADDPLAGSRRPTALGVSGRLLPHDRPWGPFLILVDG